jgi:bifunctional non-homologous end joining protein LigD
MALADYWPYIGGMLSRVRNSRGRPKNAPAAFIEPCRPTVSQRPPRGPGWAHELKHDGYRLQIHVHDGRVRLLTMNAADWTARYPRIVEEAARIKGSTIIDAEVICVGPDGVAHFDLLHSRCSDHRAIACGFDLLMLDGGDLLHKPFAERKATLRKLLRRTKGGIQYVEHVEGDGCPFRKSYPHILMMESGQNGDGDDLPIPLDCSTQGCIFL